MQTNAPITLALLCILFIQSLPLALSMNENSNTASETTWIMADYEFDHDEAVFRDICFLNATHGWISGQNQTGLGNGVILHTDDGGKSWAIQLYNESQWFDDLEIVGETIWVAGLSGLFYSVDWGQSWRFSEVVDEPAGMAVVKFVNNTHGWTSTMNSLFSTNNGGETWSSVSGWTFQDMLRRIHSVAANELWAIGFFGIYHSDDSGNTWEQKHDEGGSAFTFVSSHEAWAVGNSMLAHMTDGEVWIDQPLPRTSLFPTNRAPYFGDIIFIDANHGWIVGLESPVAYTPNGGVDWYTQNVPLDVDGGMLAVYFINRTHGWASGTEGIILRTTRGDRLGPRLWTGLTDPRIVTLTGIALVAVCGILMFCYRRRKRIPIESLDPT